MIEQAIELVWSNWRQGLHYPAELRGKLSMHEGYRVQLGLLEKLERSGQQQAGWKVGLTAEAMRIQHGVHEPCFGFLLASGNLPSGSRINFAELISPGFENELCIHIGTTLRGPGVSIAQARAAIDSLQPALEIVEKRGDFAADLPLTMADNAQQRYFVTGSAYRVRGLAEELRESSVEVTVDDQIITNAHGKEVMGDPAASIAWLANKLAEFGLELQAGMRVMSGSFTKQFSIDRACTVRSRFAPFGEVSAEFV